MPPVPTLKTFLLACSFLTLTVSRFGPVPGLVVGKWVFSVGFIFWFIFRSWIYPFFISPLRHVPTVPGALPIIGHAHILASEEIGVALRKWHATHGPIFRYFFPAGSERLSIADDEAIKLITLKDPYNYVKPTYLRRWMTSILGSGVLLVDGEEHMRQRKALSPAFSTSAIRDLIPTFFSKALLLTRLLSLEVAQGGPGTRIEILEWLNRATLDIIALAGFGYEINSLVNSDNPLRQAYSSLFAFDISSRISMGLVIIHPIFRFFPTGINRSLTRARKIIDHVSTNIIRSKVQEKNAGLKDIIALTVQNNHILQDDQQGESNVLSLDTIRQQIMTFLAAGHDTTATGVAWTLDLLSKRPDAQERLRQEIRRYIPELSDTEALSDSPSFFADVDQLPYLSNVCRESLRFIPPIPTTLRENLSDANLCGYHVPKGTWMYVSSNAVNRLPAFWGTDPSPDIFEPDRWENLPPQYTTNSFLTFLHGPRGCIGRKFAETEMKVLLCCLLSRFWIERDPEFEDQELHKYWLLVLRPRDGINLKMTLVDSHQFESKSLPHTADLRNSM
ncbi:MAG: hypothetical protein Q9227_003518 [Pyrenula ochraceoflavens]